MAGRHARKSSRRLTRERPAPYGWLGTGAIGLGLGAAVICGAGTAHADDSAATTATPTGASIQESAEEPQNLRISHSQSVKGNDQQPGSRRSDKSETGDDADKLTKRGDKSDTSDDADKLTKRGDKSDTSDDADNPIERGDEYDAAATPGRVTPFWQRQALANGADSKPQTVKTGPSDTSPLTDPAPAPLLLSTVALATAVPQESLTDYDVSKSASALNSTAAAANLPIEVRQEYNTLGELQTYTADYGREWILNVPSWSTLLTDSPDYMGGGFPYRVERPAGDTLGGTDIPANLQGAEIPDNLYVVSFQSFNGTVNPASSTLVLSIQRLDSAHTADVVEQFVYDPVQTWYYSQIWAFEFDPFAGEEATPTPPAIKNVTVTEEVYGWIDLLVSGGSDDDGIAAYQILKGGQLIATVDPGEEYRDYDLQSGITYVYTARLVDTTGQVSADSNPLVITTKDVIAPTAPTITSFGVTSHSATLTAFDGTDNVGVVSYNIYRDGVRIASQLLSHQPFTDEGLDLDVQYVYTARAVDAAFNESADSRSVTVVTYYDPEQEDPPDFEKYWEDFNSVVSLIPGVNVFSAGASLVVDLFQLGGAFAKCAFSQECADIADEFGDIAGDLIAFIPFAKSLKIADFAGDVVGSGISFWGTQFLGWYGEWV